MNSLIQRDYKFKLPAYAFPIQLHIQMSFVEINFIKTFECDEKIAMQNIFNGGLLMVDI